MPLYYWWQISLFLDIYVTAQYIISPPYVDIINNTKHIFGLMNQLILCIGLQIERNFKYLIKMPNYFKDGSSLIDVFMPVRNTYNISIYSSIYRKEGSSRFPTFTCIFDL